LVDKSLVVAEVLDDGSTWYRLLETMRQYGWQRLTATRETAAVQRRHADFYLVLSERAELELLGRDALHWFEQLDREHDNLRAALTWCLGDDEQATREDVMSGLEIGLRMAGNLRYFWMFHDHHREELAWLDQALPRGRGIQLNVRGSALVTAGVLAGFMNDLTRSQTLLAEGVELCRELGERGPLSAALSTSGWTLWRSGDEQQAAAALAEGLALARVVGEPWLVAYALMHDVIRVASTAAIERCADREDAWTAGNEALRLFGAMGNVMRAVVEEHLGQIAVYEGDYERAHAAFAACLPSLATLGWRSEVAATLVRLADAARALGDGEEASIRYTEALALYRQLGDQWLPAVSLVHTRLAALALEHGDRTVADRHVTRSLTIAQDIPLERALPFAETPLPNALEVQAALAAVQSTPVRALRLAGAAATLRADLHQPQKQSDEVMLEQRLAPARLALTAEEQAQAWGDGQRMTADQAIAVALQVQ
jgi:tetratricopeptide (TPR) repeat protein